MTRVLSNLYHILLLAYQVILLESLNNIQNIDRQLEDVELSLPDNGMLFEGDMIMTNRLRYIIRGRNGRKWKKSAFLYLGFYDARWPKGIIYYQIESTLLPGIRRLLENAMGQLEHRTCIRFRRRVREVDYVVFSSRRDSCYSNIGMNGGRQVTNLGRLCGRLGTVEHELMHVLGMIHEHSRPDRDRYIKINFENIGKKHANNFAKYSYYETDNLKEDFNFASIMLYSNFAFSMNGRQTIESVNDPDLIFGQREQFSIGDIRQINFFYKCKRSDNATDYKGLVKNYYVEGPRRGRSHMQLLRAFERAMKWIQESLGELQLVFLF